MKQKYFHLLLQHLYSQSCSVSSNFCCKSICRSSTFYFVMDPVPEIVYGSSFLLSVLMLDGWRQSRLHPCPVPISPIHNR
eukprot:c3476_g1_i1 orf=3-239(-)